MDKQLLSGWFSKLAADPMTNQKIRMNNIASQYAKIHPGENFNKFISPTIDKTTGLFDENSLASLLQSSNIDDMGNIAAHNLGVTPWDNGNAGTILKGYAGAHPMKTAAGIGLGLANVSGLMDNDYWGGQALGALAGGLGSKFFGKGFSPMLTMAGGAVGSLFDKLREKQKSANQQQYYRQ